MKLVLISFIKFYQIFLSPFFPPSCRFYPSCSHYGIEAIQKYGGFKGCYLTAKRICRCHPWNEGGNDPVP